MFSYSKISSVKSFVTPMFEPERPAVRDIWLFRCPLGGARCPEDGTESTHFPDTRRVGRRAAGTRKKKATPPAKPISQRNQLMPSDEI